MPTVSPPELGFRLVTTPNPAEFSIAVTIRDLDVVPERMPVPGVTLYDAFKMGERERVRDFGGYVFTLFEAMEGVVTFYFARVKTPTERGTPFRVMSQNKPHGWPTVLLGVAILRDSTFPHSAAVNDGTNQGIANAARLYPRYRYVPGQTVNTRLIQRLYLSEVPFAIAHRPSPLAEAVHLEFLGLKDEFEACLHRRLTIAGQPTAASVYYASGVVGAAGHVTGQTFPATNMPTWQRYTVSDEQEFVSGQYLRTEWIAQPPAMPKPLTR